jgi:hypothetical protein
VVVHEVRPPLDHRASDAGRRQHEEVVIDGLLAAVAAKGNGFAVGEVTGPGVERWHVFVRIRLAVRQRTAS